MKISRLQKINLIFIFLLFASMLVGAWANWQKQMILRDLCAAIFALSLSSALGVFIYESLKKGEFQASQDEYNSFNTFSVSRKKSPKHFWSTIIIMGAIALASLLFAAHLLYNLF